MKHNIISILAILLCGFSFSACTDNDYAEMDKGRDVFALSMEQPADTLDEQSHANEAITFNWTTGQNYGTGNRICYLLELDKVGDNFANAYTVVDKENQVYTWSLNQENLNNLLLDKFGGVAGKASTIEARVSAIVDGQDVQTSTVSFSAVPYLPVTSKLYIIGDAAPNGWSADNATEMTRTDNGIFTWEGNLKVGDFKFITTSGQFLPSYNNDGMGNMILRSNDEDNDLKFNITKAHYYKLTANLLTGKLSVIESDGSKPKFENLYFVGNPTGWGFVEMTRDVLDSYLFRYGSYFESGKGGEFKFGTSGGSWENMYKATQANAPYSDTSMELVTGFDPDDKWYLKDEECNKAYKICVDIRDGKERMMMHEFSPYSMVYLVGDATPNGWDLGNATSMEATDSPYIFTWTGTLNAGEMKLSCDRQSDWNGAWFMPASGNDVEPTGSVEHALFINKGDADFKSQYLDLNVGDIDQKWKITSSGTYTVTMNQLEETVSIVKH